MQQQQGHRAHAQRRLMHVMDVRVAEARREMRELVQLALVPAPVIVRAPVANQFVEVVGITATVPTTRLQNPRTSGPQQSCAQIVEYLPGNVDSKRFRHDR
jgi:hypothetical protein